VTQSTGPAPTVARHRTGVELAAARTGAAAALVLAYAAAAHFGDLPRLPVAMALAATTGLLAGVLVSLQHRPRLSLVWAEMTFWVAFAFTGASAWNAWVRGRRWLELADLLLGIGLLAGCWLLLRAVRQAPRSGRG